MTFANYFLKFHRTRDNALSTGQSQKLFFTLLLELVACCFTEIAERNFLTYAAVSLARIAHIDFYLSRKIPTFHEQSRRTESGTSRKRSNAKNDNGIKWTFYKRSTWNSVLSKRAYETSITFLCSAAILYKWKIVKLYSQSHLYWLARTNIS